MKNWIIVKILLFASLGVLCTYKIHAQYRVPGVPYTIQEPFGELPTFILPDVDNAAEHANAEALGGTPNCSSCKVKYYAKGLDASFNVKTPVPRVLPDGSKMWKVRVKSNTALGMQFYFSKFKLPYGASLYIYNDDKTEVLGAFTYLNNNRDPNKPIQFGTQWISGNKIYLEYVEPAAPEFAGELEVTKIAHIFEDVIPKGGPFGGSGLCNKNVSCPEGWGWEKERNTIALILAYSPSNKLFALCSGAVINNTAQDGRPLLLSANHCVDIIRPGDPCYNANYPYDPQYDLLFDHSTWLFLFNHQTKTCSDNGSSVSASTIESVYGSLLLSRDGKCSPKSDYLLLELNTSKGQMVDMGVCYAGWSRETSPGTASFVGIHHPAGDVKKISVESNAIQSTHYANTTVNASGHHWKVADWDAGVTEGGSSGSPLFNSNHQIVGQLHGGGSKCNTSTDNGYPDWYGKFSTSWTEGGFAFWLDPNSGGQTNIHTLNFPGCRDGIQNGNETGVDCGGDCKPCSIVYPDGNGTGTPECNGVSFSINNKPTNNGQVINVCKSSIMLNPASYSGATCIPGWLPTLVYTRSNRVPCNMYTPTGSPVSCRTDLNPNWWLGLPDGSCECRYLKLFISIQECNADKVPTGSEIARWYDIPEYMGSFSLTDYVAPSLIHEGKHYKVKVGSSAKGIWREYTAYMRVYTDNLTLQNQTLNRDQFGRVITIQNSTVPASPVIKVVAKNEISLLAESTFSGGNYYIADFDCNGMNQFQVPPTHFPMAHHYVAEPSYPEQAVTGIAAEEKTSLAPDRKDRVNVYPNPAANELNVDLLIQRGQVISVYLYGIDGHLIKEIIEAKRFEKGHTGTKLDCSDIPNGIYVVKVLMDKGTVTKKVVILHQ